MRHSGLILAIVMAIGLGAVGCAQKPAQLEPPNPAGTSAVEGTYWKAIELAGKPVPTQDPKREAHLQFQAGGRVSGSDGCNRITGAYELHGDRVTFGQMAGTQMACLDEDDIERRFRDALQSATRLTVTGDRLELFEPTGRDSRHLPPVVRRPFPRPRWRSQERRGSSSSSKAAMARR